MSKNHHLIVKKFSQKSEFGAAFFTDLNKVSQLKNDAENFLKKLPKKSLIIVREYHLSESEREEFARKIFNLSRTKFFHKKFKILIGKNFELARKIKADGVHFSDHDFNSNPAKFITKLPECPIDIREGDPRKAGRDSCRVSVSQRDKGPKLYKKFAKNFIFSLAIHQEKSLKILNHFKANIIFISPIFKTTSHQNQNTLGTLKLRKILAQKKRLKLNFSENFALGGINDENYRQLLKLDIHGFGAIDFFKNF